MKKINILLVIFFLGVTLFTSCEKNADDDTYGGPYFISFEDESISQNEASSDIIEMIVILSAPEQASAVTVNFSITSPDQSAVEGTDYEVLNATETLTFAPGIYSDTIFIAIIDNVVEDGNKAIEVTLNSTSNTSLIIGYPGEEAKNSVFNVTIIDNDCAFSPTDFAGSPAGVEFYPNTEFSAGTSHSLVSDIASVATYEVNGIMSGILADWGTRFGEVILETWPAILTIDYSDPYNPVPSLGSVEQQIYHTDDGSDEYYYNVLDNSAQTNSVSTCGKSLEVYYTMIGYYGAASFTNNCYLKVTFDSSTKSLVVVESSEVQNKK